MGMGEIISVVFLIAILVLILTGSLAQFFNILFIAAGGFNVWLFLGRQIPYYAFLFYGALLFYLSFKVNKYFHRL